MSSLISIGVSEIGIDDRVRVPAVFTKNRDRLLTTEISRKVMAAILAHREVAPLLSDGHLSDGHFSVDGTPTRAVCRRHADQGRLSTARRPGPGPR